MSERGQERHGKQAVGRRRRHRHSMKPDAAGYADYLARTVATAGNEDADERTDAGRDADGIVGIIPYQLIGLLGTTGCFGAQTVEGILAGFQGVAQALAQLIELFARFPGSAAQRLFGFMQQGLEIVGGGGIGFF